MHLLEQKQFLAAFDLTYSGMAGTPADALRYTAVHREVVSSDQLWMKSDSSAVCRSWEMQLNWARLCR